MWAYPNVSIIRVPLNDDPVRGMTDEEVTAAVVNAGSLARYMIAGHRALVTCHQGRNRSALVAGLAMMQVFGMTSNDVVAQIRETRHPHALGNPSFVRLLQRAERRD